MLARPALKRRRSKDLTVTLAERRLRNLDFEKENNTRGNSNTKSNMVCLA